MKSLLPFCILCGPFLLGVHVAAQTQTEAVPNAALPVRAVSLFSSGVAYTERGGDVSGDATIPLTFRIAQINDILKSMVLLDTDGQVQPVTYGAHDPISRALQSFAVDVTRPQSRAELLGRLRGSSVTVTTAAGQLLTGQIVGVEDRTITQGEKTYTVSALNLLSAAGLQSVYLDDTKTIRLLDPRQDREFRQALTMLASGADDQRRTVLVHFAGAGRRAVSVGYVTEAPLWKISYRLLLGGSQGEASRKPYLQGWALVENTTDDDWQKVHLSLVSGRPVSFIQDLYQPLYLPRPVVAPDTVASPEPQTHEDSLAAEATQTPAAAPVAEAPPAAAFRAPKSPLQPFATDGALSASMNRPGAASNADVFRHSVSAQARGGDAGEQYQYDVTTPVTLPRQQAAMIPVVAQEIGGEKVLLYNADSDPKFALDAVRLHNTTALHLKGGPLTLFDGGVYAGDARMEDVPPGATRLISYALDLSVLGDRQQPDPSSTQTLLSLKRGVLIVTKRERRETDYTFKSQAQETKTVLVEHPYDAEYTLIAPAQAEERTGSLYRFAVPLAPGQSKTLKVVVERPLYTTVALLSADLNEIGVFASRSDLGQATRDALRDVLQRRRTIEELNGQARQRDAEITAIGAEQERIRKNMGALDRASALYKRYVGELDTQETRIQTLRTQSQQLQAQASEAERALRARLDGLTL